MLNYFAKLTSLILQFYQVDTCYLPSPHCQIFKSSSFFGLPKCSSDCPTFKKFIGCIMPKDYSSAAQNCFLGSFLSGWGIWGCKGTSISNLPSYLVYEPNQLHIQATHLGCQPTNLLINLGYLPTYLSYQYTYPPKLPTYLGYLPTYIGYQPAYPSRLHVSMWVGKLDRWVSRYVDDQVR